MMGTLRMPEEGRRMTDKWKSRSEGGEKGEKGGGRTANM